MQRMSYYRISASATAVVLAAAWAVSPASATAQTTPAPVDVRFMQGMIAHHGQAVVMAALVPDRTTRKDVRLLAEKIDVSQRDEIAMMKRWLTERHQTVPQNMENMGHAMQMPALMPGMLTGNELAQLAAANGAEFDRLFLTYMIRHHEGALQMVAQLFGTAGAAQEAATFSFASDVDADQRGEIKRMQSMLGAVRPASSAGRRP